MNLCGQATSFNDHQLRVKRVSSLTLLTPPISADHQDWFEANLTCKYIILKDKTSWKNYSHNTMITSKQINSNSLLSSNILLAFKFLLLSQNVKMVCLNQHQIRSVYCNWLISQISFILISAPPFPFPLQFIYWKELWFICPVQLISRFADCIPVR